MLPIIRLLILSLAMGLGGLSLAVDFGVLKKVAQLGHKDQPFFLGLLYADKKNDTNVIWWLEKSAHNGLAKAQYSSASYYDFSDDNQQTNPVIYWLKSLSSRPLPSHYYWGSTQVITP